MESHSPAEPLADRAWHRALLLAALTLLLGGCAALTTADPPRVNVVGIEPLASEGLEIRLAVKLRVQNPNEAPIEFDGIALDLEVNGKLLASGVSDAKGTVPRFGEAVLSVPVSISALAAVRQAMGLIEGESMDRLPYVLRGKLASGVLGTVRFANEGTMAWPRSPR
jgi:LEA14-like dessication related protein